MHAHQLFVRWCLLVNRELEKHRDALLVEQGKNGDRRALEKLVGLYHQPVYNLAYRIVGDVEMASDVTQNTFLRAFEKLAQFNPEYKFFSWIYRIATNEAIDQAKSRDRFTATDGTELAASDTEAAIFDQQQAVRVQRALGKLSEDYRTVISLRHFSEMSYEDISEVLVLPVKTVRSRLYSARQLLKTHLDSQEHSFR
jgi:RNA polymerase sigma-70 factor (ECF subfamily)